jgi:L-asparaginase/Glu-tRNA(Gln) amidotransferase subunit D
MLMNERKYLIVLLSLLLLSIFTLIFYRNDKEESEPYKAENNKILLILFDNNKEIPLLDDKQSDKLDLEIINDNNINELVNKIEKKYGNYDAFVIITSRENITHTSSLLSFMLENIKKPFVVSNQLSQSILYASQYNIPEVVVLYDDIIIRGCRARDLGNDIISHNYPILGEIDNEGKIKIDKELILPSSKDKFKTLYIRDNKKINVVKAHPNKELLLFPNNIYIIEGYITNKNVMDKIRELVEEKGAIAVNVSGKKNEETENFVIYSEMTPETTYAKMAIIMSNVPHCDRAMAEKLLNVSMRGEF